jgi:hypothetical protein
MIAAVCRRMPLLAARSPPPTPIPCAVRDRFRQRTQQRGRWPPLMTETHLIAAVTELWSRLNAGELVSLPPGGGGGGPIWPRLAAKTPPAWTKPWRAYGWLRANWRHKPANLKIKNAAGSFHPPHFLSD